MLTRIALFLAASVLPVALWYHNKFVFDLNNLLEVDPSKKDAVLVTGASSGIGRDAALSLASQGFTVFACIRKPKDGEPRG